MEHCIAIGEDCGVIALIDIRQPNEPTLELTLDNRNVWKVLFNPIRYNFMCRIYLLISIVVDIMNF